MPRFPLRRKRQNREIVGGIRKRLRAVRSCRLWSRAAGAFASSCSPYTAHSPTPHPARTPGATGQASQLIRLYNRRIAH